MIAARLRHLHRTFGKAPMRLIANDQSGVALTEFAFVAPFFLSAGLLGTDTANYVITHMRVSQIAMHVADNASRVGEQDVLVERKVYEDDINDVFIGADRYSGGLDLLANGRVILSSLETNSDGGQWIRWQRCYGDKTYASTHGTAGDGATGTNFAGMGSAGARITATPGDAVMFVEIAYDYQSFSPISVIDGETIIYTGSFNVRDSRAPGLYQTNPVSPVANCS